MDTNGLKHKAKVHDEYQYLNLIKVILEQGNLVAVFPILLLLILLSHKFTFYFR